MRNLFLILLLAPLTALAANGIYAEVNPSGTVINMVEWDGVSSFPVAPNTLVSASGQPNAQIGGTYLSGVFTAPAAPAAQQGIGFINSPTNGSTVPIPNVPRPANRMFIYLQPASALTSVVLQMPSAPQDNDELNIQSSYALSGITYSPAWTTGPSTLAAGAAGKVRFVYSVQTGAWFQW